MSTNSTISIENQDGSIKSIYCHWDGYTEHNGKILQKNYTTSEKIEELLNLGSLSFLGESTEKPVGHTFDNPVKGYCIAYGRDRGTDGYDAVTYKTIKEMIEKAGQSYNYLFKNDCWFVQSGYGSFTMIEEILQLEEENKKMIERDTLILGVRWFAGKIGIAKLDVPYEGIKYFIAIVPGYNEESDKQHIADWGNT